MTSLIGKYTFFVFLEENLKKEVLRPEHLPVGPKIIVVPELASMNDFLEEEKECIFNFINFQDRNWIKKLTTKEWKKDVFFTNSHKLF